MKKKNLSKNINLSPLVCIDEKRDVWKLRWNIQSDSFEEIEIRHKPTLDEIKEIIYDWYNSEIEDRIVNGFRWKGIPVCLNRDNQHNYSLFIEAGLAPIELKLGTSDSPVFYTFKILDELKEFREAYTKHIRTCLQTGWVKKNNIDWNKYIL